MRQSLLALGLASVISTGCMSVVNHSPYFCADETKRDRVYGGVRLDAEQAGENVGVLVRGEVKTPREFAAVVGSCAIVAVDLPFSLIADTLWLPQDIRTTRSKKTKPSPVKPTPESTVPAEM